MSEPRRSREMKIREFLAEPPFCKRNVSVEELKMFDIALTHDSYANEDISRNGNAVSNERLEFLGDAVMELCVCEHFYVSEEADEGCLTDRKIEIICNRNLPLRIANSGMDIDGMLLVGEGHKEKRTGCNNVEDSMRADTFEAILGAVYLLYGIEEAKRIVYEVLLR
jgi:ribonuclease-3